MKSLKFQDWLPYVVIIFLGLLLSHSRSQLTDANTSIGALNDELKQSYNERGELQSSKKVLMGSVAMLREMKDSKDSLIRVLAQKVNRNTISRGVVTQVIHDTVEVPAIEYVKGPCDTIDFKYRLRDKWGEYNIRTCGNTAWLDYTIQNAFTVDMSWKKSGFLKPKVPVVIITDHNPHSQTKEVIFIMTSQKGPRKWWEYAAAFGGGYLLGKL